MLRDPLRGNNALRSGLVWAVLLWTATAAPAATAVRWATQPSPSPDGSRIAFQWLGDLWVADADGGRAVQLTLNNSAESSPVWSPDGNQLAFYSNRNGNGDVYLMDANGGEPRRLTWHGSPDIPLGFSADGQSVLFETYRAGPPMGGGGKLYSVPLSGGTPIELTDYYGSSFNLSPDGNRVVFHRGSADWTRRNDRGAYLPDIWLQNREAGTFQQLTDFAGSDDYPVWIDDQSLVFVSDRDGVRNLYRMNADGSGVTQLSNHAEPIVRPRVSADGTTVAYAAGEELYLLTLPDGQPRRLEVLAPADRTEPDRLYETRRSGIDEYAVAPSGKEAAFIVRGDVYVTRYPDGGPTTQITNTAATESSIVWSPDSKTLWFVSDRDDNSEIYSVTSGDEAEPRLRRTDNLVLTRRTDTPDLDELGLEFSPDGKQMVLLRRVEGVVNELVVADADLNNPKVIHKGWILSGSWSPDGRWLAGVELDNRDNSEIMIMPADGSRPPVNVSRHPLGDYSPVWSGDGTKLAWLSQRLNDQNDVYYVWLNREAYEKSPSDRAFEEDDAFDRPDPPQPPAEPQQPQQPGEPAGTPPDQPEQPEQPEPAAEQPDADDEAEAEPEEAGNRIDLEGLHERLVRLTATDASEGNLDISPDGKTFVFTTVIADQPRLVATGWENFSPRTLVAGSVNGVEITTDGRSLRFIQNGLLTTMPLSGGPQTATAIEAQIDRKVADERAYVFDYIWRRMGREFYDPNMHGVDWNAMREKYRDKALSAPTRGDFGTVINLMLGELNSSHQGYYVPGEPGPSGPPAADLGVMWTNERGRGLVVDQVVEDSPAFKAESRLQPGDRVLSVDGVPIEAGTNVYELLVGKVDERINLQVEDAQGQARTVFIRPTSAGAVGGLLSQQWIRDNRRKVDELSGGRLGYAHIGAMNMAGVESFQRDLAAAGAGKDGLLIDVRFNGGGWTANWVLDSLIYEPHTLFRFRGMDPGVVQVPQPVWLKPVALLVNQNSFSNAEILTHAWQMLDLGPVIGTPTGGGVIGTTDVRLVDGSTVRVPFVGVYRTDGVNEEHNPAVPDIVVPITPADEAADRDPQLEAAVQALMQEVEAAPVLG